VRPHAIDVDEDLDAPVDQGRRDPRRIFRPLARSAGRRRIDGVGAAARDREEERTGEQELSHLAKVAAGAPERTPIG
jgi:hypothetical protein